MIGTLLVVLTPSYFVPASLAPPPAEQSESFLFVGGHLGFGLPIGAAGVELGVGHDWFRASASAGIGLRGMLIAGMVRAVHEFSGLDVGLGIGISHGPGTHTLEVGWRDSNEPDWEVQDGSGTLWNDIEFSVEAPLRDHGFMRAYVGATRPILYDCEVEHYQTHATMGCNEAQRLELQHDAVQPYIGVAAGFRLPM